MFHEAESGRPVDGGDCGAGHIKELPLPENINLRERYFFLFELNDHPPFLLLSSASGYAEKEGDAKQLRLYLAHFGDFGCCGCTDKPFIIRGLLLLSKGDGQV